MKILVTGSVGFIGYHLIKKLMAEDVELVGLDNINDYYDVRLKYGRLEDCGIDRERIHYNHLCTSTIYPGYRFIKLNLEDKDAVYELFEQEKFDKVCHLAAQAGVRYSLQNPHAYINSNILGFLNILEACRHYHTDYLVYASSSSVYGLNENMPFSTRQNVDHPLSLYAATKKSCELMAHNYSHLYGISTVGLRFFSVYGPWGRPDMALFKFTKNIKEGIPIDIYNHGQLERDFTYISDIVEGIVRVMEKPPQGIPGWSGKQPDPSTSKAPYRLYNIGNGTPVRLMDFIEAIEEGLGKTAQKNMLPMQPGDVPATWADCRDLQEDFDYSPNTPVKEGINKFLEWYLRFYDQ